MKMSGRAVAKLRKSPIIGSIVLFVLPIQYKAQMIVDVRASVTPMGLEKLRERIWPCVDMINTPV